MSLTHTHNVTHMTTESCHTCTCCNTLQHTATHCITLQFSATHRSASSMGHWDLISRTPSPRATTSFVRHKSKCSSKNSMRYVHCNTLQHTAPHTTKHCKHTAKHCHLLQHTLSPRATISYFRRKSRFPSKNSMSYTQRNTLQHMVARCNTHCNTHCNTLLPPERLPHLSDASQDVLRGFDKRCSVLQRVAVCRSVLQ